MQNLVLIKYSINTAEDLYLVNQVIKELKPYYNLSLLIIQRDNSALVHNVPIFSCKELYEFHDFGLALDMPGAKYMEKMSLQGGWLLEILGQLGYTKFTKIKDLKPVLENAGVTIEQENNEA